MQEELLKCDKALGRRFDFRFRGTCAYIRDKIQQFDGATIQLLHQYHDKVLGRGKDAGSCELLSTEKETVMLARCKHTTKKVE